MSAPSTSPLVRRSAIVASGTLLAKISGFARLAVVAYVIGFTRLTDTYNLANETPNIVYELLLGGILTATFVPVFVSFFDRDDEESIHAIVTTALVALTAISVIGVLAAPWIVELYTSRLTGADRMAQRELATTLLRYFMPQMFFFGIAAVAGAILNARRRFAAPAFTPILNNIVVIATFMTFGLLAGPGRGLLDVAGNATQTAVLGLGTTLGVAAMALALLPAVAKTGYRFRWRFRLGDPAVRRVVRLSGWTIGYVAANQVALWFVLVLANGHPGSVSAYLGAYVFFILPHGLFATSIMTALAPDLAAAWNERNAAQARTFATKGLRLILAIIVPAAAVEIALGRPIIVALLQRGQFTGAQAALTGDVLTLFGIGLVAFSLYLFSLRVCYASQDTRTPFLLNCAQNGVNILLAWWWYDAYGVRGLALAFSISYIVAAVVALTVVGRRLHGLEWSALGSVAMRVVPVAMLAGGAAWMIARAIGWDSPSRAWLACIAGIAGAGAVVAAGYVILRVDEAQNVLRVLGKRRPVAPTFEPDSDTPEPGLPGVER
ncbi:MAG: murein biosynthesis integral membrane protein MurJ [Acidimicrobiia bacterium]